MSTYDMDALFHPKVEIATPFKNSVEYTPSPEKGQNGVYKSVFRFVTWWKAPQHSFVDKWTCWLEDPITTRGRLVDCPSSVGKPSPLQDMYFKLKKSESVQEQHKANTFSRKRQFIAIVQIIKDDQNKELEGKLMIYKFGKKIFEKIETEKKPVIGDAHEPFDLIDGKAFALVITKVSGYNNYDQSKFLEKKIPLLLPDENGKLTPINTKTPREDVFNYLKENSPNLDEYMFEDWNQETKDYVNNVIMAVTGQTSSVTYADARNTPPGNVNVASSQQRSQPSKQQQVHQESSISVSELSIDDLDLNMNMDSLPDIDLGGSETSDPGIGLGGDLDDALGSL